MAYNVRILDKILGKTITHIAESNEGLRFTVDGKTYKMYHEQDCCENVELEDIVGDLQDLVGHPLLEAEEVSFNHPNELDPKQRVWDAISGAKYDLGESQTWTYYKFATIKGSVTLRWYGSSNGYYGESVSIVDVDAEYSYAEDARI